METLAEANRLMAQGGERVIHLSLGQPGRGVPERVLDGVAARMRDRPLGYTESGGMKTLRRRLAQYYRERIGVDVEPERIIVTLGSSSAFILSLLCAFEAGDDVAISLPCYPAYPNILRAHGLRPVWLRAGAERGFQPDVDMLKGLSRPPKGLITASPSNPAGTIMDAHAMRTLAEYCEESGIALIADEIYQGVTYDKPAGSMLSYTDQVIVVNSFSKYFLMPGWRIGWAVVPPQMAEAFESLASSMFISPSAIAQYAALEVLECQELLDEVVSEYAHNRAILLRELPAMGLDRLAPVEGGFFVYADVSHITNDSAAFCRKLLHEARVAAVPGIDFDPEEGHRYVRFSFSGTSQDMQEAMQRMRGWMGRV